MAVYCSAEHKKAGKKEHKSYCARLAQFSAGNVLQPTKTQAPTIQTTTALPKKDLIVVDFVQLCELVNQQGMKIVYFWSKTQFYGTTM